MNMLAVSHEFDGNVCKLRIPIPKRVESVQNCDVFVDEHYFMFVADVHTKWFRCPRRFDIKDMKNIPISFNSDHREYTCRLPCYPDDTKGEKIEKGELDKKETRNSENTGLDLRLLSRITDSCVLTIDGEPAEILADFNYGFSGRFRGKSKYTEDELGHICRITNPGIFSSVRRAIQRERDETKDFCADQYKLNFVELQIPEGHENPINYTICYDDVILTTDEECVLHNITSKDFSIKLDAEQLNIDFGLISILLAICYDVRSTANELTCESAWTRTVLSSALCYFERFDNLTAVVESFLRRSLIYPLYRNYDLSRLCVEDTIDALQKGKCWIVKQLLVTYNIFCQSEYDYKPLNSFFIKDYIRYVGRVLDSDHLLMLSRNLKNVLLDMTKKQLRLGLAEIETELLKELIEDIHLTPAPKSDDEGMSDDDENATSTEEDGESEGCADRSEDDEGRRE